LAEAGQEEGEQGGAILKSSTKKAGGRQRAQALKKEGKGKRGLMQARLEAGLVKGYAGRSRRKQPGEVLQSATASKGGKNSRQRSDSQLL